MTTDPAILEKVDPPSPAVIQIKSKKNTADKWILHKNLNVIKAASLGAKAHPRLKTRRARFEICMIQRRPYISERGDTNKGPVAYASR